MKRIGLAICLSLMLCVSIAAAQDTPADWRKSTDGSVEYNCAVLPDILADQAQLSANADQIVARTDASSELTLQAFIGTRALTLLSEDATSSIDFDALFADAQQVCATAAAATTEPTPALQAVHFTVIVNGNVNLRACPGTDCDVVGTASDGSLLSVTAISGDWYQVRQESGTAFIASRLTTRGPDAIITVDQRYFEPQTGCAISFDINRGDMGVDILLNGRYREEVLVDLYRPHETRPLSVSQQFDKLFLDTNEPYIDQAYYLVSGWSLGTYQLEITLGTRTSKLAWELATRGEYNIYVECNVPPKQS